MATLPTLQQKATELTTLALRGNTHDEILLEEIMEDIEVTVIDNNNQESGLKCIYCNTTKNTFARKGNVANAPNSKGQIVCEGHANFCEKCKKKENQVEALDEDYICNECKDDDALVCEKCENKIPDGKETQNEFGNSFCTDCYNEEYTQCTNCDEELQRDDAINDQQGNSFCSDDCTGEWHRSNCT